MALPEERRVIADSVQLALSCQDRASGLIPNRIPERAGESLDYRSSDATLLCFIAACRYLAEEWNREFAERVLRAVRIAVDVFREPGRRPRCDGPPRVEEQTGLLLSVPQHSWIDTACQQFDFGGYRYERLPNRVSPRFLKDLWRASRGQIVAGRILGVAPLFLPEINAQWITMLGELRPVLDRLKADASEVLGTWAICNDSPRRRLSCASGRGAISWAFSGIRQRHSCTMSSPRIARCGTRSNAKRR